MVSNALNTRHRLARPPVVCVAPPKPPTKPLELEIRCQPEVITTYQNATLHFWCDHPARPEAESVPCIFHVQHGYLDPPPATFNRLKSEGVYYPPDYPTKDTIKVTANWIDGTTAFAFCTITVTHD